VLKAQTDPLPDPEEEEQQDFLRVTLFRILVAGVAVLKGAL
jgi:hypothetical protein